LNPVFQNINPVLKELDEIKVDGIYTMSIINTWLKKHNEFFEEVDKISSELYLVDLGEEIIRLPPSICGGKGASIDEIFTDTYWRLNDMSILHKKETYFKEELLHYHKISNNKELLNKWLTKNKTIGEEEYVCFFLDFLDYKEDAYHLIVFFLHNKNLEVFIDRADFKYTIEFMNIFNKLHWS